MYVTFSQSTLDILRLRKALESGSVTKASGAAAVNTRITLEDGTEYKQLGKLFFSDITVDPTTGKILMRAEVPNPQGILLPGMFVRIKLEQSNAKNAVLLPQQAVNRTSNGDTVMIALPDGSVAVRPVKVQGVKRQQWVVTDGLKTGDQVIVEGFQKLRGKDTKVKGVPWKTGQPTTTSPPSSLASSAVSTKASAALQH
jgi:membrane fusion protein (multidrug efflux system)